jgi:hypothetical protein
MDAKIWILPEPEKDEAFMDALEPRARERRRSNESQKSNLASPGLEFVVGLQILASTPWD